ncbi:MAG TPA: hypothetical protein ENJ11_07930 [Gammaproteobacteria bacterium]|nr:hypothetical protein [Gammaproteobacteria bacterium]
MTNTITASVEFFFKGRKISASIDLDLDRYMQTTGTLPDLYPLLANAAGLDLYSYEYEIMQMEPIVFHSESELVKAFIHDGELDIPAFEQAWKENNVLEQLQQVARQHLAIDDLQQQTDIKEALLAAYRLGKKSC